MNIGIIIFIISIIVTGISAMRIKVMNIEKSKTPHPKSQLLTKRNS